MKVKELEGEALDRAVGFAEGCDFAPVAYSTKWEFGGPIIERERIQIFPHNGASDWCGVTRKQRDGYIGIITQDGHTPLIAAMRCYVASKLGDEVDVPDELLGG